MADYQDSQDPKNQSQLLSPSNLEEENFLAKSGHSASLHKDKPIITTDHDSQVSVKKGQQKQQSPIILAHSSISQKGKGVMIDENVSPPLLKRKRAESDNAFHPKTPSKAGALKSSATTIEKFKGPQKKSHQSSSIAQQHIHVTTKKTGRRQTSASQNQQLTNSDVAHEEAATEEIVPVEIAYTPLHEIKDYHSLFNISVRVTRMWYGKLYGRDRPRSLVLLVKDAEGTTMEAISTAPEADKFKTQLIEGHTYSIENVMLGKTDKPFRVYRADDQLFLDELTSITPCVDNEQIGTTAPYFHRFNRIEDMCGLRPCLFSVIGYVVDMPKWYRKQMPNNTHVKTVDIYMIDATCYDTPAILTVWEDILLKYGSVIMDGFKESFVLVARDIKARKFGGVHKLETTGFTTLEFDPVDNPEVKHLLHWIQTEYPKKYTEPSLHLAEGSNRQKNITTIEALLDNIEEPPAEKEVLLYDIVASVAYIYDKEEIYYEGCAKCRKKVPEGTRGQFTCDNCGLTQPRPTTTFKVRAAVEDRTGQIDVVLFGSQAQLIMREPVDVIKKLRQEKNSKYLLHKHTKDCLGIVYNFTLKITQKNYRYIHNSGFTVQAATRVLRDYKPHPPLLEILGARHSDSETSTPEKAEGTSEENEDDANGDQET